MPRRPGPPSPAQLSLSEPPEVFLWRETLPHEIAIGLRERSWERIRPGAYVRTIEASNPYEHARLSGLAHIAAVHRQARSPHVISHVSAALLHGLPVTTPTSQVHLIQSFHAGAGDAKDVRRHRDALSPLQVTARHGIPVTSLERTAMDCARTLPRRQALVVVDAALHVGAKLGRCEEILDQMRGRRGVRAARWVLEAADAGAESAGESLARAEVLLAGLPRPVTQVRIEAESYVYWGDLGWPELRVLVEYDGVAKYEARGSASAAVLAEKRRQERLESAGWAVVRLSASDLRTPTPWLTRLTSLLHARSPAST